AAQPNRSDPSALYASTRDEPELAPTTRTACDRTAVVWTAVLLAGVRSLDVVPTVAVLEIVVPVAVLLFTRTTRVKTCGPEPAARLVRVAVTAPVPPTEGVAGVHPTGAVNDTNVVFAGTASLSCTACASVVPLF